MFKAYVTDRSYLYTKVAGADTMTGEHLTTHGTCLLKRCQCGVNLLLFEIVLLGHHSNKLYPSCSVFFLKDRIPIVFFKSFIVSILYNTATEVDVSCINRRLTVEVGTQA